MGGLARGTGVSCRELCGRAGLMAVAGKLQLPILLREFPTEFSSSTALSEVRATAFERSQPVRVHEHQRCISSHHGGW